MTVIIVTAEEIAAREAAMLPLTAEQASAARFVTEITADEHGLTVRTRVEGIDIDRRDMVGYGVAKTQRRNAERLARAIEVGAVFHDLRIATDVNGSTYLAARSHVSARYLPSDLRKIGF